MADEEYFPFRSVAGDRKYSAEDWAAYFALFLGNGIFYSSADKLKVSANEGMKLKVGYGAGFIAGRMYRLKTDKIITLDTADGALNRIDRIVLRCDYTNRCITLETKKGSYSENPTAPELTRDADIYELALADVYVSAGVVTITADKITDQRLNTSLCGIVTGMVDQADTTDIFNQFTAYLQEFKQTSQADFEEWWQKIKDMLNEDGTIYVEVSNSNTVTEAGIALDARQANPDIVGSMAYKIAQNTATVLTGTLTSGTTSVTISDTAITTESMIDIYTSVYGVNPTEVTTTNGAITLKFDAQKTDVGVKVKVL